MSDAEEGHSSNDPALRLSLNALAQGINLMTEGLQQTTEGLRQMHNAVNLLEQEEKKREEDDKKRDAAQRDLQSACKRIEEGMDGAIRALHNKIDRVVEKSRKNNTKTNRTSSSPKKLPASYRSVTSLFETMKNKKIKMTRPAGNPAQVTNRSAETSIDTKIEYSSPANPIPSTSFDSTNSIHNNSHFTSPSTSLPSASSTVDLAVSSTSLSNSSVPSSSSSSVNITSHTFTDPRYLFKQQQLFNAVFRSKCKVVVKLIKEGITTRHRDRGRNTVLHIATENSNFKILEHLVQNHGSVNVKNSLGQTPLHLAALYNKSTRCAKILMNANANINFKDKQGLTPLDYARFKGNKSMVKFLCKVGAIHTQNSEPQYQSSSHIEKSFRHFSPPSVTTPPYPSSSPVSPTPSSFSASAPSSSLVDIVKME